MLVIIGGLVLVGALYGIFMFGDKNADGVSDNQIIMVVQPSGDDAKTDMQYSEVNKENAKANVFNMTSVSMIIIVFMVAVFFLGFVGLMLGSFGREQ